MRTHRFQKAACVFDLTVTDRIAARLRNRPSERGGEEPNSEEEEAILTASRPKRGFPASPFFAHFPDFERRHATQIQGCHMSESQGGFGNPVRRSVMSGMEREEERRGKSSGRKGMAQRAERGLVYGGEEERGAGSPRQGRPTKANRYRVAWRYMLEVRLM